MQNESKILTHLKINQELCGTASELRQNYAQVTLKTNEKMVTDDWGLIHGGFVYGAADYAAMLAVNDPLVVLGKSAAKYLRPVEVGQEIRFEANLVVSENRKRIVQVEGWCDTEKCFTGEFICILPERHVLDDGGNPQKKTNS